MSALLEILLKARDEMTPAMKQGVRAIEELGAAADKTGSKLPKIGASAKELEKIDSAGRQARIGLSAMAQAADLVGVNISGIVGPAASAADAIGDMVGAVGALGATAGVIGGVVAAIGLVKFAIDAYNQSIAENIMYSDQYLQNAYIMTSVNGQLAASFSKLQQATIESKQVSFENIVADSPQFEGIYLLLQDLGVQIETSDERLARLKASFEAAAWGANSGYDALERLRGAQENLITYTDAATEAANAHATALSYEAAAAARGAAIMGDTRGDAIKDFREGARSVSEMNTKAWKATHEFKDGVGWVEKLPGALDKASSSTDAMAQAAQRMASKLQSMVEGALTPTAADPNMGNAWDEARKRFEAFASGTDTGAYGAEFKQLFDSLGMSAQQAADAFRNFSLFADPKNLKLVDFGPIAESVKTQLDGMIGKANLTSAAMEEVWKNLSPQQKAALGTQGIDNVTDAVTALINPAGLAEQNVQGIGTAVKAIPEKRTTTFDIKKTDTFDATYKDIADKISAIPTDVTVRVRLADGLPDTGGSSGGSSGGLGNPLRERAGGGPVFAGTPYMVGENGPEMFVPRVSGSIVPNSRVQNFGGITINGNFFVRSDADVSAIANALAKRWGRAAALRSAMRI